MHQASFSLNFLFGPNKICGFEHQFLQFGLAGVLAQPQSLSSCMVVSKLSWCRGGRTGVCCRVAKLGCGGSFIKKTLPAASRAQQHVGSWEFPAANASRDPLCSSRVRIDQIDPDRPVDAPPPWERHSAEGHGGRNRRCSFLIENDGRSDRNTMVEFFYSYM